MNGNDKQSAAAQEAAAEPIYQLRGSDGSWIDQAKHSYDYNMAQGHETNLRVVYATPVAAAPTLDAELAQDRMSELCDLERDVTDSLPAVYYMDPPDGGSVSLGEQVKRMAEDAALWRKHSSTPAAPGIDLEQFRDAVIDAWRASESGTKVESKLDAVLALIDASPKGGYQE